MKTAKTERDKGRDMLAGFSAKHDVHYGAGGDKQIYSYEFPQAVGRVSRYSD
jgi:hypothetical protein